MIKLTTLLICKTRAEKLNPIKVRCLHCFVDDLKISFSNIGPHLTRNATHYSVHFKVWYLGKFKRFCGHAYIVT